MKTVLRKYYFLFFSAVLFYASCSEQPNEETIRVYASASNSYTYGRFAETIEILRSQNNFPPALLLRAKAEYFYGDLDKAEESCRRAIRFRSSLMEAHFYLARILFEKNDIAGAQAAIETLLADNPQDIRALRFAAQLASEAGKYDDAVILLDRAVEFSAECAMVLLDRARIRWILAGNNNAQAALEDLSRAKAMLPWDTPVLRSIINLEKTIREVMQ